MLEQLLPPEKPSTSAEEAIKRQIDWIQRGLVTRCVDGAPCADTGEEPKPDWYLLADEPLDDEGFVFPVDPKRLEELSL